MPLRVSQSAIESQEGGMCLIACVFENLGDWEEIRVAFFRVAEAFRGSFTVDV